MLLILVYSVGHGEIIIKELPLPQFLAKHTVWIIRASCDIGLHTAPAGGLRAIGAANLGICHLIVLLGADATTRPFLNNKSVGGGLL